MAFPALRPILCLSMQNVGRQVISRPPSRIPGLTYFLGRKTSYRISSNAVVCLAGTSANQSPADARDPYEVLGVNPFQRFDLIKAAFGRKFKDAERRGDTSAMEMLETAYDQIMMKQLSNRKQGLSFGSFKVSKEIKLADQQALFPWGPRFAKSNSKDTTINAAVSAFFVIWIFMDKTAGWRPLQFLIFSYMFTIFNKLKQYESDLRTSEDGADKVDMQKKGKRLLRTLALVFTPLTIASMVYTGALNCYDLSGQSIPRALLNTQNLLVTLMSSLLLFITGSFYR